MQIDSSSRPGSMSGERVECRLAAIFAADVAGYSRLMGQDEAGTLAPLRTPSTRDHRSEDRRTQGPDRNPSVVEAVSCAVEFQRAMAERNTGVAADERIEFRVGINLGDVIVEDGDIFRDGVNVAARLEALAEPSGIRISRTMRDQIRDKLPHPLEDIGEQSVRNIARQVRVYALRPEAVANLSGSGTPIAAPRRRRTAIAAVTAVALCARQRPADRCQGQRSSLGRSVRPRHR
jgi:class 3 adenylate cyclase